MSRNKFDEVKRGNYILRLIQLICRFSFLKLSVPDYLCYGRIVVFGADVTPIDIMCHMPAICEEKDIPYCYTPSREDIGHAAGLHRTAVMVLIKPNSEYEELFDECKGEIQNLPVQL